MSKNIRLPKWAAFVISRLGWRSVAVALAGLATVAVTIVLYLLHFPVDPVTPFGAIFDAWIAGVALFVVGGVVVGIVSLVPPEAGSFDYRARVLFRNQGGAHVDYIVRKILTVLEPYAETVERHIEIQDYEPTEKKFLTVSTVASTLRSYIDDMQVEVKVDLEIKKCIPPPVGRKSCRMIYIRCDDKPLEQNIDFSESFHWESPIVIPRNGNKIVETQTEYWVGQENDPFIHRPTRFTKSFDLTLENHLPTKLRVRIAVQNGREQEVIIDPGAKWSPLRLRDVNPGEAIFRLALSPA